MTNVVFDTNILFSGFGWKGSPYHCIQLARQNKVLSVTCFEILAEFEEKLQSKMTVSSANSSKAVTEIILFSKLITIPNKLKFIADDPDDDRILECALIGNADYIVTGDHHLLSLGSYMNVKIVNAKDFLALMSR